MLYLYILYIYMFCMQTNSSHIDLTIIINPEEWRLKESYNRDMVLTLFKKVGLSQYFDKHIILVLVSTLFIDQIYIQNTSTHVLHFGTW